MKAGVLLGEIADEGHVDLATGEVVTPTQTWLRPLAAALTARKISVNAAEAIRAGLGSPNPAVTAEQLEAAAVRLCTLALRIDVDSLLKAARGERDELDVEGVRLREDEARQLRLARMFDLPAGGGRLIWDMDPETYAVAKDIRDRATSPKLGGVRFVDPTEREKADSILKDGRTVGQLLSDALLQLLRLGADANPDFLLGSGAPVIRVTATRSAVQSRVGLGRIEGQSQPVSIATVERLSCGGVTKAVVFDESGLPLDVGREQRCFTSRQREALAVKWGGCAAPGCDRPPSWCEAHHTRFWARDHGRTDTADGILLCRHHHLLFHNNGWEIERDDDGWYWLIPPLEQDPEQKRILLESKSAAMRDLWRERAAG